MGQQLYVHLATVLGLIKKSNHTEGIFCMVFLLTHKALCAKINFKDNCGGQQMVIKKCLSALLCASVMLIAASCGAAEQRSSSSSQTDEKQSAAQSSAADKGEVTMPLNSVKLLGRAFAAQDGSIWMGLSGTGAEFDFTGEKLTVSLVGSRGIPEHRARVGIFVDGERMSDLAVDENGSKAEIRGKGERAVNVRMIKLSECAFSCCAITAIDTHGGKLKKSADKPRKIEFIGDSITCGYGNEGLCKEDHFDYATENHYYSYASITARSLEAQHWVVARSGIGAYRNYGEPKSGSPGSCMPVQYEYTGYAWNPDLRKQPTFLSERWDFSRYQPDVVCINLGTNDLSTDNYDLQLLKQGYQKLLQQVRRHNPQAKILFLTGSMLGGKELQLARQLLDEVAAEARKAGDQEVYRFDLSPIDDEAFYGNDYHPNVYEDEKMAAELTAYLRKLMGWF